MAFLCDLKYTLTLSEMIRFIHMADIFDVFNASDKAKAIGCSGG
jgi:hypothetical protein